MKIRKQMLRILVLFINIVLIYNIKGYCTVIGTKRMEITGGEPWVSINIGKAYAECESLNSTTSTLGTNNLRAHLTTDADWSAMAIFSISQYGATTTNTPESTTGNASGIYNPGRKLTYAAGISNIDMSRLTQYGKDGLFNSDGSLKPYMRKWSEAIGENNFVGFKSLVENGTYGWFNSSQAWNATRTVNSISMKSGLFGIYFGWNGYPRTSGGGTVDNSFRPVIWN